MSNHGTHRKGQFGRRLLKFIIALLGLFVGAFLFVWHFLGSADYRPIHIVDQLQLRGGAEELKGADQHEDKSEVYIHDAYPVLKKDKKDPNIRNILVFGVDGREVDEPSRADSIMILTLDRKDRDIRITSIMRDSEFTLETSDQLKTKINAAYVYGGVGLLINTLNEQLDLDIQEYMMFDFWSSAEMIDAIGGIEITVEQEEIENLNIIIREMNHIFGDPKDQDLVTQAGPQILNGKQAVSWARIRYVGTDFARTQRQRTVVMTMIQKAAGLNPIAQLRIGQTLLSGTSTNLGRMAILETAWTALGGIHDIAQYRVPEDGLYTTNKENWNMIIDWGAQTSKLHAFIWEGDN